MTDYVLTDSWLAAQFEARWAADRARFLLRPLPLRLLASAWRALTGRRLVLIIP